MADIIRPIEPFELTQGFGENPQDYARFGLKGHNGWDLRTKYPDTPQGHRFILASWLSNFYATGDEGNDGFGKYFEVIVTLNNTWKLTYGHCLAIDSFTTKNEGESMGISDNTGNSTGDHLHLTAKKGTLSNGKFQSFDPNNGYFGAVNPQGFFDELRAFKQNNSSVAPTTPTPPVNMQPMDQILIDLYRALCGIEPSANEVKARLNNPATNTYSAAQDIFLNDARSLYVKLKEENRLLLLSNETLTKKLTNLPTVITGSTNVTIPPESVNLLQKLLDYLKRIFG